MTKVTMAADRRTNLIACAAAAGLHLGALLLLWQMQGSTGTAVRPPAEPSSRRVAERTDRRREGQERQRNRVLPEEHARLLMEQSELLVRQELQRRIERFDDIAAKVVRREEGLLEKIEHRPAAVEIRDEVNHTAQARVNNAPETAPLRPDAPIQSLYDRLAEMEARIQTNYTDAEAAELALRRGQSYPEVRATLTSHMPRMPAYQALVAKELAGKHEGQNGQARLEIRTIDDLNAYREVLKLSSRESALAEARLMGLLRDSGTRALKPAPGGWGTGTGQGDGYSVTLHGRAGSAASKDAYSPILDPQAVQAQALPGRRFSRNSPRRGWLYINTWYMIGPWDDFGRNDFAIIHPPELGIDFDAVYTNGQRGVGIAERDSHPIEVRGDEVRLDGTLRWKFMQSESIHNVPPVTTDWSTYYAYTELYFDEPAVMYVAVGTDDSGKVWINGEEIWQDRGMSWYRIDEHVQQFRFRQGVNRVLVRLENDGGGATGFSFLVCPAEAIGQRAKK